MLIFSLLARLQLWEIQLARLAFQINSPSEIQMATTPVPNQSHSNCFFYCWLDKPQTKSSSFCRSFHSVHMYTASCAEENGIRLYASCLCFFEEVPAPLAARHEQLWGALASRAICLLSHQPFLATMEQVCVR